MSITEEETDLLQHLATLGLMPGVAVTVVEKTSLNGSITVKVDGINRALSHKIASIIKVKEDSR